MMHLAGKSMIFLKIAPDYVEVAMREIGAVVGVSSVEKVMGTCNIVVTGRFPDSESLTSFAERLRTQPYCQACSVQPNLQCWERGDSPPSARHCWALIRANDTERTLHELRRIPEVKWVLSTSGDFNMIAIIGAEGEQELHSVMESRVRRLPGIARSETLVTAPSE